MKKILMALGAVVLLSAGVIVFNSYTFFSDQQVVSEDNISELNIDKERAINTFATSLSYPTISYDDTTKLDKATFLEFQEHLARSFPTVYKSAEITRFSELTLLYKFAGTNTELKPVLFMGHQDVVPVDEATLPNWVQPPFSGTITADEIWGRGALDDKISVLGLLEAMEAYLQSGKQLNRTIYFSFGHDEEIGGKDGAQKVAQYFRDNNVEFEFILDEGGVVTQDMMPGIKQELALIGIAEKGYLNLTLTVEAKGGHSSQPPNNSAVGILSQAIVKIEANQFKPSLSFLEKTVDKVGHYMTPDMKIPFANLWLFRGIVEDTLLGAPSTAASIRTTIAATMIKGSSKSNILPTQASAVVNFRLFPGHLSTTVQEEIEAVIDDPRVKVEITQSNEGSTVSKTDSFGFKAIESSIRAISPDTLVAPYLVTGGTDAKHFDGLSPNIYRFMMIRLNPETMSRFHGLNERITIEDYINAIGFYHAMIEKAAK